MEMTTVNGWVVVWRLLWGYTVNNDTLVSRSEWIVGFNLNDLCLFFFIITRSNIIEANTNVDIKFSAQDTFLD